MSQSVNTKIIINGPIAEILRYENPIILGGRSGGRKPKDYPPSPRTSETRRNTIRKAIQTITRLIEANFRDNSKAITLTFSNFITNIDVANKELDNFIRRLKRKYRDFKHLTVTEFTKQGSIHFHMICNLSFVDHSDLFKLWGHGFVYIRNVDERQKLNSSIASYMIKALNDDRLAGKKAYKCSKGLIRPRIVWEYEIEADYIMHQLDTASSIKYERYQSDYFGEIQHIKFLLQNNSSLQQSSEASVRIN